MSNRNWNCDGDKCAMPNSVVRLFPLGGGANLILCLSCALHENRYRQQRATETGNAEAFPQVNWFNCEIYPTEHP